MDSGALEVFGQSSLVTGASGFIGRHLVNALRERGDCVTALLHRQTLGDEGNGIRWQTGDLLKPADMLKACRGVSVVYHLAAVVPGRGSHQEQWRVNYEGTRTLLQACVENGVKRLVFLSSVAAYRPPFGLFIDEDWPIGGGDSYGYSKAAAEQEIAKLPASGLCRIILRPCQVYGPGDNAYTEKLLSVVDRRVLFTVGRAPRPFSLVYIDDLVAAIVRAGTAAAIDSGTFNIVGPTTSSLQALYDAYAALTGQGSRKSMVLPVAAVRLAQELRWVIRNLSGDAMRPHWRSYADDQLYGSLLLGGPVYSGRRAKLKLAFEAKVPLSEGLAKILA